ncbi:MAG: hypothetical protein ACOYXC_04880 [Candidatus Rifleibacteriota bacterium]
MNFKPMIDLKKAKTFFLLTILVICLNFCTCDRAVAENKDSWTIRPGVLVIAVLPLADDSMSQALNEKYGWNDPLLLAKDFIADIKTITHGQVQPEIRQVILDPNWPEFCNDMPVYDHSTFKQDWEIDRKFAGKFDYVAFLKKHQVRKWVENKNIDEVWIFGFPGMGCYETCMAGEGAIWCNGPVIEGFQCSRSFVVYGFNYERDVDCMLENLGHRAESMLAHIYRNDGPENPWARFSRYEKNHPGEAGCGNVHFAPNSERDYDWGNPRKVYSTCDDWARNFPALTGEKKLVSAEEWGSGDMRLHHIWWMSRFPHHAGEFEGKLANWWKYIFDWNNYRN